MMEVLFEYSPTEYRCIIHAQKSQLYRDIEHHLTLAGISEPEVAVLSRTICRPERKHDGRTEFFLQRWNLDWKCFVNVNSLEEVVPGDRLTVASRRPEKQGDHHIGVNQLGVDHGVDLKVSGNGVCKHMCSLVATMEFFICLNICM